LASSCHRRRFNQAGYSSVPRSRPRTGNFNSKNKDLESNTLRKEMKKLANKTTENIHKIDEKD